MANTVLGAISRFVWARLAIRKNGGPPAREAQTFEWQELHEQIKNARLFVVSPELIIDVYGEAQKGAVEPLRSPPRVAAPKALPFESCFLTTDDQAIVLDSGPDELELVGFILARRSEFRSWMVLKDLTGQPVFQALYTLGQWRGSSNLGSLVIPRLVAVLNRQPKVVGALTFAERRHWNREAKGAGLYPQPYYVVNTPSLATESSSDSPRCHTPPSYRFDSRSHQRLLCHRGPVPLSDQDRTALDSRGYEVFEHKVPEKWESAMQHRGHSPIQAGEWVALRYVQVKASIRGNAELPYVPSIRIR